MTTGLAEGLRHGSLWQRCSPVTRVRFRGVRVHVKRDDVFHLAGNKMRKLQWFVAQDAAFFQAAHLVSFGGAQSNAMLAIAQLAHAKRVPFSYLSRLPAAATTSSSGNLQLALALGMRHVALSPPEYAALAASTTELAARGARCCAAGERAVLIPQGAAFAQARDGLAQLAHELNAYVAARGGQRFSVVVPCGTGTTALYLAQHLNDAAQLFAVPCVGDAAYLAQQFQDLVERDAGLRAQRATRTLTLPTILAPRRKARFGRLAWPLVAMHRELLDATGIEFDLNYGAFAWHTMFDAEGDALALLRGAGDGSSPPREVLYVHTGGVSGNATMLERYLAKGKAPPSLQSLLPGSRL
ncbi:hypothetical protein PybrP1_012127 [[Pythium] brassicae (nom. inval.)]|nr:hypothetical protein PybrP1_012127 [[Pythium] brassicae (nom. inval.)]